MIDYTFGRAWTERPERNVDYSLAPQGKVFWLPAKEELPERAVKRAHGKGAVEEGIYHHPVVAISQPSDDSETVHFHLVHPSPGIEKECELTFPDHIPPRQATRPALCQSKRVPRESTLVVPAHLPDARPP